jgi:acid phosphatase family membrane protein YuiD
MNNLIIDLISNQALLASGLAWFVAQTIKATVLTIKKGKFNFNLMLCHGDFLLLIVLLL